MARLDIGGVDVGDRVGGALEEWGGDTIEEEEVEDDGETVGSRALATLNGRTVLHEACITGEVGKVRALLQAGADIDATDEYEQTPLMYAFRMGHEAVILMLYKAGACRDVSNIKGGSFGRKLSGENPGWWTSDERPRVHGFTIGKASPSKKKKKKTKKK